VARLQLHRYAVNNHSVDSNSLERAVKYFRPQFASAYMGVRTELYNTFWPKKVVVL